MNLLVSIPDVIIVYRMKHCGMKSFHDGIGDTIIIKSLC